jgi:hypothetical protein
MDPKLLHYSLCIGVENNIWTWAPVK